MEIEMVIVTESPLDPEIMFKSLRKENAGSVIFHYAVVKNRAGERMTSGILFEINGDLESELSEIEADIRSRWETCDILLARRIGLLHIGDLISLVAVSSPASDDAFDACRYGLGSIRKIVNIKKTELYLD